MARGGYDVWIVNYRGTRYSQDHMTLNVDQKEYWDFSWEILGSVDLPSTIDYITSLTGYDKIAYMGLSMGSTSFLAGASLMPEYFNEKIMVATLFGTVTSLYYNEGFKNMAANEGIL